VRALLPFSDPKQISWSGGHHTALTRAAAAEGQSLCVAELLAHSDIEHKTQGGLTALMHAAKTGNLDSVRLLAPVANAHAFDAAGKTALMHAAAAGRAGVVEFLLSFSDARQTDDWDEDALMHAASGGHDSCVEVLLPASDPRRFPGADKKASTRENIKRTALMHAANKGHAGCVDMLLPHSDPNAQDNKGLTALMACVGRIDCARILAQKTNVNLQDNRGETALMIALNLGQHDTAALLAPLSDMAIKDNFGRTALDAAIISHHSNMGLSPAQRMAPLLAVLPYVDDAGRQEMMVECEEREEDAALLGAALAAHDQTVLQATLDHARASEEPADDTPIAVRRPPRSL